MAFFSNKEKTFSALETEASLRRNYEYISTLKSRFDDLERKVRHCIPYNSNQDYCDSDSRRKIELLFEYLDVELDTTEAVYIPTKEKLIKKRKKK